ncbi:MAG TPA: cytochrome b/b6 domain-containing protein [Bacteroidota bacterium]|nr:cytochrome b/b6 domain-containing protein [Bacteroidota bacterium]
MKMCIRIALGWLYGYLLMQSPLVFAQTRTDCLTCHSDSGMTKEVSGKTVSLFVREKVLDKSPHRKLVCVACHAGFKADDIPHKAKITPVECLTCHKDAPFKHTFHPQLAAAILKHEEPDVSCKDCHGTHDIVAPSVADSKFSAAHLSESCGECHGDVKDHYGESAHGKAFAANVTGAPNCLTCHSQRIASSGEPQDSLVKIAQMNLCLSCHRDDPDVRSRTAPSTGFISSYETSVHGSALLRGNQKAANCVDCHGSHEMKKGSDPAALVNRSKLPETCGKCHADIAKEFSSSVHGMALAKGVSEAPTCTNCHGEHTIYKHNDPRSSVSASNISAQCSTCHSSVKLTTKYGLPGGRTETFADSYHGLAIKGGAVNVANCASCHGAHNIRPSADSTSTVNKANLAGTCGKCHPGANTQFAVGSVHVAMTAKEDPMLYWIATIYLIGIVTIIGGMVLHNGLDFLKKARRKLRVRRGHEAEESNGHALYLRMTLNERLQHASLMISFFFLVLTGFMLRYPDAWWVAGIRSLSDRMFDMRSVTHRIAAIVMIVAGVYHVLYIAATRRGRELVRDLVPKLQDGRDAISVLKYNLGISKAKPKFGRFSYIEKSEYWALVWGTIVMAVTGVIMWFDNTFIGLFSKLGYDISRTIHFYEAWLATLAIIVWHLYYVIFNPDTYPMNIAWFKGTLTEAEMEEEHPLELENLRAAEASVAEPAEQAQEVRGEPNKVFTTTP